MYECPTFFRAPGSVWIRNGKMTVMKEAVCSHLIPENRRHAGHTGPHRGAPGSSGGRVSKNVYCSFPGTNGEVRVRAGGLEWSQQALGHRGNP